MNSSMMYAMIRSCSSPVLVYDTVSADATLYWKNDMTIKLTDFNDLKCFQVGCAFGSFKKQSVHGFDVVEVMSISKVTFFEAKTDGKIHILLGVSGKRSMMKSKPPYLARVVVKFSLSEKTRVLLSVLFSNLR